MDRLPYPPAPTADIVDDYHGTPIADPYRPLEDADAPATRAWSAAQRALADEVLATAPGRDAIRRRLAELWDRPRRRPPFRRGSRWFQLRNTGLQDQDVLWTADGPDDEGRVLLDPNPLGGGTTTIVAVSPSDDGELVAVALAEAGSDWNTWSVLRTATGELLADHLHWSKFSGAAWTRDGAGFFYGRYPEPPADAVLDAPNLDMTVRYHRIGTDPVADPVVFATPHEPEWGFEPQVTDDGRLLVITVWRGTDPENRVYAADLGAGPEGAVVRPVLDAADAHYGVVGARDGRLYLVTDKDAPLGRIVGVDLDAPDRLLELVPEGADALEQVLLVGGRLAAVSLHDAHARLGLFELDGTPVADVALPGIGSILEAAGEPDDEDLHLSFMTFTAPASGLAVSMADGTVRAAAPVPLAWDPAAFETELAFVASGDGTRVPLFLARRRDVRPDGDVPALLYGYGGFGVSIGPTFKPEWLAWMERGGLLAVACLRGGGEYGKAWHDDGRLASKQHVFDDMAACARHLVASGWTRPARLGVTGRSNGGLLAGAMLTQQPDLFGAVVAEVGVMDMLRFHRFTIGWAWTSDYGSAEDSDQFRTLLAYSPLHNVVPGRAYPATLVTTGDHDDRVVPAHSYKFAATLQAAQGGDAPVLLRVDIDAGHGSGKPVGKLIDERADVIAFLELALGGPG